MPSLDFTVYFVRVRFTQVKTIFQKIIISFTNNFNQYNYVSPLKSIQECKITGLSDLYPFFTTVVKLEKILLLYETVLPTHSIQSNNDLKVNLDLMETLFSTLHLLLQTHINIYLKLFTKALG